MEIRTIVQRYIKNESLSDEDNLVENGLDSLNFVKLIVDLEEEYGVTIEDEELLIENFNSVKDIVKYLREKCGVAE